MKYPVSFIVELQFLGFRFHGWQKQKGIPTLHDMVDKTLSFVFKDKIYKTIGVGRTDAKVSAHNYFFQLFLKEPFDTTKLLEEFNYNTSADIRAICITEVNASFNIINHPKVKEYHYYFSYGEKCHPFAAPFLVALPEYIDIDKMKLGAKLFQGVHHFQKYCTKPSENTQFKREIISCEIKENSVLTASFFPEKSYVFIVKGKGFLRYQIRLMMATLFELGKGNLTLAFIENSLKEDNDRMYLRNIAPASGLQLFKVSIEL